MLDSARVSAEDRPGVGLPQQDAHGLPVLQQFHASRSTTKSSDGSGELLKDALRRWAPPARRFADNRDESEALT